MDNIELGFFGLLGMIFTLVFYGVVIAFAVLLFRILINVNKALKIYISKNETHNRK